MEVTGIHQSETSHVSWDEPIGRKPWAKLRISVPGKDSEPHTYRLGAGRLWRKAGKESHTHCDETQFFQPRSLPVGMIPVASIKGIVNRFRNLEANATWP